MRLPLKELLEKLGVDRELSAYETQPWFFYDEEKGISCSAEVRMGPSSEDMEAEIQFVYDERDEEEGGGEDESGDERPASGRKQIMRLQAFPVTDGKWSPKTFSVKGEEKSETLGGWEEKACNFFQACIQAMNMGELPEIEELIEKELQDDTSFGGGRRGRVGRKSPKVKPGALLGMGKKP